MYIIFKMLSVTLLFNKINKFTDFLCTTNKEKLGQKWKKSQPTPYHIALPQA